MDLVDFDYELPREAIAQHPAQPRDSARLLDMDGLVDRHFRDLPELLAPGDLLVVNRTRVRPARLVGRRETGGSVEVLLLRPAGDLWRALVRPARKLPQGASADFDGLLVTVERHLGDGLAEVRVESDRDLEAEIARVGQMPLPPYITEQLADDSRYQTVYADEVGSAAAPTAGLHFTPALLERLERGGVEIAAVVLEVGLATFRPITAEVVEEHVIHSESYSVDDSVVTAIGLTREPGGRVIAVGTTSVRALESAAIGDGLVE